MNEKQNIQHLITYFQEKHALPRKEAEAFVKTFFQLIAEGLEKDKYVKVRGLGTFKLIDVDSRESVNVHTGTRIQIQGHSKIAFAPENSLKEIVNKPFAHFESVVLNDGVFFEDDPETSAEEVSETEASQPKPVETQETSAFEPEPLPTEPLLETTESSFPLQEKEEKHPVSAGPCTENRKTKGSKKWLWASLAALLLLVGAATAYFLREPNAQEFPRIIPLRERPLKQQKLSQKADSLPKRRDTLPASKPSNPTPAVEKVQKVIPQARQTAATPFVPDSTSYRIIGTRATHTIKEGETLTRVALKYYGTKALWPYLVKHNPNVIKNPNNVPYGTVIQIPELTKKQ
ncbi:MAG: HU family DNA-binding protein [Bacteroides sp.]|nr:HU family DNA-binding protein [Bacteroides sp.]